MPREKAKDQLSELQLCALIALWTRPPGTVPNTDLTKLHLNLDRPSRDKLKNAGLLKVQQERQCGPVSLELTEAGRDREIGRAHV